MLIKAVLIAGAIVAPLGAVPGQAPAAVPAGPPYVETTGYGERRVTPDRATVMINVTTKAASAAAAAAENARVQSRVMDTLRTLGLGAAASTASYNVGPNYEPEPERRTGPRQVGYAARSTIRIRLTELSGIGRVIDATLARGATGVEGVFFDASTAPEARRAATAEAAAMARADADALARALGGALGPMISASTSFVGMDRRAEMMMRDRAMSMQGYVGGAPTQIAPSEIIITASVVVRWQFSTAQ